MKSHTTVIPTQPQQPPVPDASVASKPLPRRARVRVRTPDHPVAQQEQAALADQPFLAPSAHLNADPFNCAPPIYDPDASFIVDSAQYEIRDLLSPEADAPSADAPSADAPSADDPSADDPSADASSATDSNKP